MDDNKIDCEDYGDITPELDDRLDNIVSLLARLAAVRYIEKQKSLNNNENKNNNNNNNRE